MAETAPSHRFSAGVVVVNVANASTRYLLLRAYRNWDFPKGLVEKGEKPIDAALREVREETGLSDLKFDWGTDFIETGPYNRGKIARYYLGRSDDTEVRLLINPELGFPEHHEARWAQLDAARSMVSARLLPVIDWARLRMASPG
ncbi:MAG TPA: NUDIX domain-containing protein [Chthoniobacterales bacterium]